MAVRKKLNAEEIGAVAGGMDIDNQWGDGTVYKIGVTGGPYTHTFSADDFENVKSIVAEVHDPSLEQADDDRNIMDALLASPYLSPL